MSRFMHLLSGHHVIRALQSTTLVDKDTIIGGASEDLGKFGVLAAASPFASTFDAAADTDAWGPLWGPRPFKLSYLS